MRVLLIQPPLQDFYTTPQRLIPLGLCSLKGAIKKFLPQTEVLIRDFHHEKGRKTISLPKDLSFLKEYYPESDQSPFSVFGPYYHFGESFEEITLEVEKIKPDLIGISSLFTPYHLEVLELARNIKEKMNVPIILGGAHATACPETMMKEDCIDFIIRGEGEKSFVKFLDAFQKDQKWERVQNLVYRKEGKVILNPIEENFSFEELPWPDRSDFAFDAYCLGNRPLAFIMSSRGCPWHCHFCSVHQVFCEGFRERSVDDILSEMNDLYNKGIRIFDFEDDNLTFNKTRFLKICEKICQTFPHKDIELTAMNGVSYLSLDKERIESMWQAGFRELNLSLVSSNPEIQKENERPFSLDVFIKNVLLAHERGFSIVSYQILGLPNEDLLSMKNTFLILARLPVLMGASPFYVPPQTLVSKKFPTMDTTSMLRSRLSAMGPYDNLRDDIFTLFITTRIVNFLKGLDFVSCEILFSELLKREGLGFELLKKLFIEKNLCGHNKKGFFRHTKFKKETFQFIWNDLLTIQTQKGKTIICDLRF